VVYGNKHFIKHVPVRDRAQLLVERLKGGERTLSSDYSSYEKHFDVQTFQIEFELYEYMIQNLPQASWLMRYIRAVMVGINKCKYTNVTIDVPSGRMSGEMNTSLGNGFVNLMLFLFNNERLGNKYFDCLVEGDDLIAVYSGIELNKDHYLELGYTIEIKSPSRPSLASFCGLICDEEEQVSITDPTKLMLTIGWTSVRYLSAPEKTLMQLLRAKGYSTLYQYPGVPIIQSLALMILRLTKGHSYRKPVDWTNWQWHNQFSSHAESRPIGPKTRQLMSDYFGYSQDEQMVLEQYFDTVKQLQPIPLELVHATHDQKNYFDRFVMPKFLNRLPNVMAIDRTTEEKRQYVRDMCNEIDNRPYSMELPIPSELTIHPTQHDVESDQLRGRNITRFPRTQARHDH